MTDQVRALSSGQIARAALVVLLGFAASGILGLVRTAVYSAYFGAGDELDVFYGAQQIPELLFTLVAGGALGSAFIPVFTRYLSRDTPHAWRLASAVMTWSAAAAALLGLILALTAPLYMPVLLSHKSVEYQALAADLARWMLVTTVIFSISGLTMGILNAHQQFVLPAAAISMNNIGLILGAVVIAPLIPTDTGPFAYPAEGERSVYGLAFGAILGAVLHLAVQLPGLWRLRAKLRPLLSTAVAGSGQVLRLMLPRMAGLAVTRLNFLVNLYFAARMVEGSYAVLNTAWLLMFFVLGIIGQSVGTAVFPSLAKLAEEGNWADYGDRLRSAMSSILFLAIPASVGLIVLGQPLVMLLVERREFTPVATAGTAWALSFFAIGIAGHGLLEVLSRAFYALSDTRTPVLVGSAALIGNIILSIVFIQFIGDSDSLARGPIAGLALANSLTTLLEAATLWYLLSRRVGTLDDRMVLRRTGISIVAALAMGVVVYGLTALLTGTSNVILVPLGAAIGAVVYFGIGAAFGIPEARALPAMVFRRLRR